MSAALLSVAVAVLWGIGASWDEYIAKKIDPWVSVAWRVFYGVIATLCLTLAGVQWWYLSLYGWLWLLAGGLFLVGGWICYMQALRRDNSNLSVALSSTYALPAVLILLILGQPVSLFILAACFLVVLGGLIAKASVDNGTHGLAWSLGTSFLWGLWLIASWQASIYGSAVNLIGGSSVIAIIIGLIMVLIVHTQGKSMIIPKQVAAIKILSWTTNGIATWLMFLAFSKGQAAQVMVISAAYPVITLALGYSISRRDWSWRKLLAIIMLCAGAALASLAKA